MLLRVTVVAAAALVATCGTASAQTYNVVSGHPVRLVNAISANPDCTSTGRAVVRVTQPPQHGRIAIRSAAMFPTFEPSNPRSICNTRRVPGVEAVYVSERGYVGADSASFEVIYAGGVYRQYSASIMVR
jgi:hypothetical protein